MFKVMAFLTKRPDVTREEFIDHYENHHVPLILRSAEAPTFYRRNYVEHEGSAISSTVPDVITELGFRDRAQYTSWVAALYAPGSGVAEDEATFLDRERTTSVTVDERVTR